MAAYTTSNLAKVGSLNVHFATMSKVHVKKLMHAMDIIGRVWMKRSMHR